MRQHNMNTLKPLALIALALSLNACSTYSERTMDDLEYRKQSSLALLEESKKAKPHSLFKESNKTYLGKLNYGVNADPKPMQLRSILMYSESTPMEVPVALNRLSIDHQISITLGDDAKEVLGLSEDSDTSAEEGAPASQGAAAIDPELLDSMKELTSTVGRLGGQATASESEQTEAINPSEVTITQEDINSIVTLNQRDITLEQWLDDFTMERGLFWDYGVVAGKPYVHVTATIEETLQFEGTINTTAEGSVSPGGAKAWEEIKEFADKSKSAIGEVYTSDATGRLYLKDTPAVIAKIKRRVQHENDLFTKEILYDLRVVSFRQSENENIQLNWQSIYESLTSQLSLTTPGVAASGFGASYVMNDPTSAFQGSSVTVNALKTILQGGREASAIGRSRNRSAFSSSPTLNATIVSGTTVTDTENGRVVTEDTTTVTSGITFEILGSILSGGRIAVDLSALYEDEISRETRTGANGDISLPTIYKVPLSPNLILRPNETAIYAMTQSNNSSSRSGIHEDLGWLNALFGGGNNIATEETLTLIILSAKIIGE